MFRQFGERHEMARIIILAARNWSLVDEKTGELRVGVKFEGCEAFVNDENDYRGAGFVEYQATPEAWESVKKSPLPGIYDVEIGLRKKKLKNGASAAVASIEAATFVSPIEILQPVKKAA